jgi:hypothetical protein
VVVIFVDYDVRVYNFENVFKFCNVVIFVNYDIIVYNFENVFNFETSPPLPEPLEITYTVIERVTLAITCGTGPSGIQTQDLRGDRHQSFHCATL